MEISLYKQPQREYEFQVIYANEKNPFHKHTPLFTILLG